MRLALLTLLASTAIAFADPQSSSWLTTYATKYARIYTTDANKLAGTSVTTWTNGTQVQSSPAYCGVQEVSYSATWTYIRTSGLGAHMMGPWYLNAAHTTAFPNYPKNQKVLYRFPRTPSVPATKTLTGLGAIGYFVDGVAMFDSRDGYVWTGSAEVGNGTGYWNREAYVNEGVTFDPGYAHQENSGTHHYHANPIALRYLLGDHVDYNATTKAYSESVSAVTKHSPILGWVRDGYPIYGPYGYSSALNAGSGVRRMVSGYQLRNGNSSTDNLAATGRTTIPAWAQRMYSVGASQSGPTVSTTYPLGRYMEDNAYLGDLGYTQGVHFDLDEYNGRYCVTPEFPGGTYAYFVSIDASGTPTFPYNIGRAFYGNPTGSSQTSISETVTAVFQGEATKQEVMQTPTVNTTTGDVTIVWSATEGGTYQVQQKSDLGSGTWTNLGGAVTASGSAAQVVDAGAALSGTTRFYHVTRTALATYDAVVSTGGGGGDTVVIPGGTATQGTTITALITLPTTPPNPPIGVAVTSVTLAGSIAGSSISRPTQGAVQCTFVIPAGAPTGAQNVVVVFAGPTYTLTGGLTISSPALPQTTSAATLTAKRKALRAALLTKRKR